MSNITVDPAHAFAWLETRFDTLGMTPTKQLLAILGLPCSDGDENMPLSWHIRNQREREIKMPNRPPSRVEVGPGTESRSPG